MGALRILFLIAALVSSLLQAAELKVAVGVQDPQQVSLEGILIPSATVGADVVAATDELAKEICRRINASCSFHYVRFAEILPGVEDGRFDLGFGNFLRTPKREQHVAFSDSIFRSSSRLVGLPATARAFAGRLGQPVTLDSLRGAWVAAMEGSQQQEFLVGIAEQRQLTLVARPTMAEAVDALRQGNADFALLPIREGYAMISRDNTARLAFVGPAVADRGLGNTVHIAMPRGKDALRRSINKAIAEVRADGTAQRIMRRHFPVVLD